MLDTYSNTWEGLNPLRQRKAIIMLTNRLLLTLQAQLSFYRDDLALRNMFASFYYFPLAQWCHLFCSVCLNHFGYFPFVMHVLILELFPSDGPFMAGASCKYTQVGNPGRRVIITAELPAGALGPRQEASAPVGRQVSSSFFWGDQVLHSSCVEGFNISCHTTYFCFQAVVSRAWQGTWQQRRQKPQ